MQRNPALTVHSLLMRYQRARWQRELFHSSTGSEQVALSHSEEGSLLCLANRTSKNIKDLASELSIVKSWMSRIITSLIERKLLHAEAAASDKRSKTLTVTPSGERALSASAARAGAVIDETLSALSERDRKRLATLLNKFVEGLGASRSESESTQFSELYQLLWRLNRAVGLTGENFLGSGLSISQAHILSLLYDQAKGAIFAKDLDQYVPFDASTISRILSRFESKKWLKKAPFQGDKRSYSLTLTAAGAEALDALHRAVETRFIESLKLFSESDLSDFLQVLQLAAASAEALVDLQRTRFLQSLDNQSLPKLSINSHLKERLSAALSNRNEAFQFPLDETRSGYSFIDSTKTETILYLALPLSEKDDNEAVCKALKEIRKTLARKPL